VWQRLKGKRELSILPVFAEEREKRLGDIYGNMQSRGMRNLSIFVN